MKGGRTVRDATAKPCIGMGTFDPASNDFFAFSAAANLWFPLGGSTTRKGLFVPVVIIGCTCIKGGPNSSDSAAVIIRPAGNIVKSPCRPVLMLLTTPIRNLSVRVIPLMITLSLKKVSRFKSGSFRKRFHPKRDDRSKGQT